MNNEYDIDQLLEEVAQWDLEPEPPSREPEPDREQTEGGRHEPAHEHSRHEHRQPARHRREPEPEEEDWGYEQHDEDYGYEEFREEYYYEDEEEEAPRGKGRLVKELVMRFAGIIFLGAACLMLAWVGLNVKPGTQTAAAVSAGGAKMALPQRLDSYMNNAAADALEDLTYIRKIYTLDENATAAPAPDPDGFGTTEDPAVIRALIDEAWELIGDQEMIWNEGLDFVPGEPFRYYYDETILVIQWKEYIDQRCATMAEVKIAHGSQLRRKLAEDMYSSSVRLFASELANSANAVIAINGDYYGFRQDGINVYQRQLYRTKGEGLDTCFFTSSGDMLFARAGELNSQEQMEQFIQDNDVLFSASFGPVLVDDGELQYCPSYPIGEIDSQYSRSCIAMADELHYLLMTINHTPDARPRCNINQLAEYVHSKGVKKAYALDGGQTAEIVMMGGPVNHVDFGNERPVTDIIYFATALPNAQEVSK